jgi:hypothetical protein
MAAGWYAHRPVLLLTAGLAGALAGWLARSRIPYRGAGVPARPAPPGPWPTGEPIPATPIGPATRGPTPAGPTRGPSPLPEPVPLSEGAAVDAPYTDEQPYTGRPRYAPATPRWGADVPGGTPP